MYYFLFFLRKYLSILDKNKIHGVFYLFIIIFGESINHFWTKIRFMTLFAGKWNGLLSCSGQFISSNMVHHLSSFHHIVISQEW